MELHLHFPMYLNGVVTEHGTACSINIIIIIIIMIIIVISVVIVLMLITAISLQAVESVCK